MQPKIEACFGIIPVSYQWTPCALFLIRHREGNHWGFPKGHAESGETPRQTAERELQEETSLEVMRYLPYQPIVEQYQFLWEGHIIDKTVTYYFAEVSTAYTLQQEEISEGKWVQLSELVMYASFEAQKKLYEGVTQHLN